MKSVNVIYNANNLAKSIFGKDHVDEKIQKEFLFVQELLNSPYINVYLYVEPQYYAEEMKLCRKYPAALFFHTFSSFSKAAIAKVLEKVSTWKKNSTTNIGLTECFTNTASALLRLLFKMSVKNAPSFNVLCTNADVYVSTNSFIPNFVKKRNIASHVILENGYEDAKKIIEDVRDKKSGHPEKLNIIYRLCDSMNSSSSSGRCFDTNKNGLIKKCLQTLKRNVDKFEGELQIYCIADSCSNDIINYLQDQFPNAILKRYEKIGNAKSFCECVNLACSLPDGEQVYFLEDDYLMLSDDVLTTMNFNLRQISRETSRKIAIMPDDYPDRYVGNSIKTECRITETGHFLKINKSTCTFATYVDVIKKNKKFLLNFAKWPRVTEDKSVNRVWKDVPLYQPIPAWTLHCQIKSVVPKYLDYEAIKSYLQDGLISNRSDTPKPW